VMGDRMARDTFYVAVTRGQEGLAIVTSDSQGLQESIGVSADRQSAIELARRAAPAADRRKPDDFHAYAARHPEVNRQVHQQQKSELKQEREKEIAHTHTVSIGI
jgi:hypothetical protein